MNDSQEYLDALSQPEDQEAPTSKKPKLTALAAEMKELKAQLDDLEETRKPIQKRYDQLRKKDLPDAMTEAGVSNFRLTEGGSVYVSTKLSVSVREDDRQQFFNWLRDHGHAALISQHVHPSTLAAWAREQLEAKQQIGPFVHVYEEPMAVLRKG